MSEPPPYFQFLKRLPAQARSVRRVEALLDAAAELFREHEPDQRGTPEKWRILAALINGLLQHAFTLDPDGDATALREALHAARAYAATILGKPPPQTFQTPDLAPGTPSDTRREHRTSASRAERQGGV